VSDLVMNDYFIRIMVLQSKLQSLNDQEFTELQELLLKIACTCKTQADCKGICAVERRVVFEEKRRENV